MLAQPVGMGRCWGELNTPSTAAGRSDHYPPAARRVKCLRRLRASERRITISPDQPHRDRACCQLHLKQAAAALHRLATSNSQLRSSVPAISSDAHTVATASLAPVAMSIEIPDEDFCRDTKSKRTHVYLTKPSAFIEF